MIEKPPPGIARRLRLSTGAIVAALILTCAAFLAIEAAVDNPGVGVPPGATVKVEAPHSENSPAQNPLVFDINKQALSRGGGSSTLVSR